MINSNHRKITQSSTECFMYLLLCRTLCYSVVEKIIRNEIKPEKSHCFF